MAIEFVQPSAVGGASSTFFHTGGPLATAAPLAFYAEVQLTGVISALGEKVITIDRDPAQSGFGGWDQFSLHINPDGSVLALVKAQAGGIIVAASHPGPVVAGEVARIAARFASTTSRFAFFNGDVGDENTDLCSPNPDALDDTLISSGFISEPGSYNCGLSACAAKVTAWASTIPSNADLQAITAGADPLTYSPSGIVGYAPFDTAATAVDFYAWNGSAIAQTTDLTLNPREGTDGAINDCGDFGVPIPPGETGEPDECGFEDEADPLSEAITWPKCILVPQRISVDVIAPTVSPGRSFTGHDKIVQPDAGRLHVTLFDVPIRTRAHALQWRDIETFLKGRTGAILVPLYEGKLSDTPIIATVFGDYPIGQAEIEFQQDDGEPVVSGMHFSIGERAYRVKRIIIQETGGATRVSFVPPLRAAVENGADMDFNTPHLRCVLASDDAMNANLEILRYATPTVEFHEDV